jgi:Uma2 family endonuclease
MVHSLLEEIAVRRDHRSTKLTYADYLAFPDDGLRHEIINGKHYVTPAPATRHQRISLRLAQLIKNYLDENPVGELFIAPFEVLLSDHDIVEPDLLFLSTARAHFLTSQNLQGPPDLVVEILSPGTRRRDQGLKRNRYERLGVDEYWLVDPVQNAVVVHRRGTTGFEQLVRLSPPAVLTTPLLSGLELPLDRVFA